MTAAADGRSVKKLSGNTARAAPAEEALDAFSARIDPWMMVLAVAWLPVLVVPLLTTVHGAPAAAMAGFDYAVWAAFGLEYAWKLRLAQDKGRFFRHHLLDLAVVAVPILRPFRLAELLRFIRLGRVVVVLFEGLGRAKAVLTHRGLHYVLLSVTLIVFTAAALEVVLERHSTGATSIHGFGQSIWWAVVTVTTVGYGDKVPVSGAGQIVAVFLMLTGIGLVGVLTATVASFFVKQDRSQELAELKAQLDEIRGLLLTQTGTAPMGRPGDHDRPGA